MAGPGNPGPYTQKPGFLGYNEIVELLPNYESTYDPNEKAYYAFKDDQWFSYENVNDGIKYVQQLKFLFI